MVPHSWQSRRDSLCVQGAKKTQKRVSSASKGFGNIANEATNDQRPKPPIPSVETKVEDSAVGYLKAVERGGASSIPAMEGSIDDSLTAEERAARVLREKYGMKTFEEQQLSAKQMEAREEQKRKLKQWRKLADEGKDFDLIAMLPAPVVVAIDRFLKLGLGVTAIAFILAGIGITVEAWSKTFEQPLPESLDTFIVQTVEPNFTTGLLVLLGFSVSLGLFVAAQLGSEGATYRED